MYIYQANAVGASRGTYSGLDRSKSNTREFSVTMGVMRPDMSRALHYPDSDAKMLTFLTTSFISPDGWRT
jgi:hypothetical protein